MTHMTDMPFATTDWSSVPSVRWEGTSGLAYWRTVQCGGSRVRMFHMVWLGGQSTMNTRAPTAVLDRCGVSSSATW